ncbi:MAG: CusA/CzcA family heavy metal efflux RND transporter [Cyanobacteria bacterium]|nr:CusA/CzcA family heavy metal efflux RND transporter [Cyanobacteriota bacterium]
MENFLAHLIRQRLFICIVFLFVVMGGIFSFQSLPIDAFPDLTNTQVQILTEAPGMAPLEVEQLVTVPIESIMNGLPKVEQVRSTSKFGISIVTVVFKDEVNTYFARQLVNERIQSAKSRIPKELNPEMGPITTGMGEIYQYAIHGNGYSSMALKTLHDWDIKYALRTVPGVNEVNTWGGFTQEYWVKVYPQKLLQYHLTLDEVFTALMKNNENFSGGIIQHDQEQYLVRGMGRVNSIEDIGHILIKREGTSSIPIYQIAQVEIGQAFRQGAVTQDGMGEVVTGLVMMLKGENSREVIHRVQGKMEELKKSLPPGIEIRPFYDQNRLVEQTIETVRTNLLEGGALVIGVLLLLLGNLRAALIVAAVIPISLMFSFMGMKGLGITANIMSLGAIDFGMIVDGSIVMVENTVRKMEENPQHKILPFEMIQSSVKEMARPIVFGILIITVVYLPILTLEGLEYKMFSPMVFTVCFALLGSLLTALTLVPVFCSFFLKPTTNPFNKPSSEKESVLIQWLKPGYLKCLEGALKHRKLTLGLATLLFIGTMASIPFLGTEFVPSLDEGDILIEVRSIPSVSLNTTLKNTTQIERIVKAFPEVKTVVSKTGRPDLATDPMGVYQSDVYVILHPKETWNRYPRFHPSKDALIQDIRKALNDKMIGLSFNFTQPIAMRVDELVSGVRSDIALKLYGPDFKVLAEKAAQMKEILQKIPGQQDLQVEKLDGSSQWVILPDRSKMARYGVNISDIRTLVETAIYGTQVSEVLEGRKRFALRVKFPNPQELSSGDTIGNLLLETSTQQRIPLAQVATVQRQEGLEVVSRESGERRIILQCNVRGRDIGSFVAEGQKRVEEEVHLPPGYFVAWGGQFENQQRASQKLLLVVPVSILIIFFLLMATFSSVKYSLLVMLNVPFGLIGGVLALWLRGMYLNVPASIGFIALFGVAVLNGLVLVSTINQMRNKELEDSQSLDQAIQKSAETRFRPVLMTALVAMLGFFPMALSSSAGAEVQKPLATVVIGGLITSTLLTLIVLPVVYRAITRPAVQK